MSKNKVVDKKETSKILDVYFRRIKEDNRFRKDGFFLKQDFESAVKSTLPADVTPYGYEIMEGYIKVFKNKGRNVFFNYPDKDNRILVK